MTCSTDKDSLVTCVKSFYKLNASRTFAELDKLYFSSVMIDSLLSYKHTVCVWYWRYLSAPQLIHRTGVRHQLIISFPCTCSHALRYVWGHCSA